MSSESPPFTLGVEEEYLLIDKETRALVIEPPKSLIGECEEIVGNQVTSELLRSQIEVGTKVCQTVQEARVDLARLRGAVIEVAARHGLAPIAASTHPFSHWTEQKQTEKERYEALTTEMQAAARRLVICGMHVHVGIDDDSLRIDLMNQMGYFLPHLLALSCSSPFWAGEDTGLKSYRLTIFDALPRTGLPERFQSFAEYRRHVDILINAGLIEDSTKIWWDLRPSNRYPTLETRIMDVCTRIDDAIALTAMLVCIMRMLYRLRLANQRWRGSAGKVLYLSSEARDDACEVRVYVIIAVAISSTIPASLYPRSLSSCTSWSVTSLGRNAALSPNSIGRRRSCGNSCFRWVKCWIA